MVLVQVGDGEVFEWRARTTPAKITPAKEAAGATPTVAGPVPVVTAAPTKVVDTPGLTISEFFGNVATKSGTASLALAKVSRAVAEWEVGWQVPRFAEYVIVNSGSLTLHTVHKDGAQVTKTHVAAGQGVYLPAGLRVKWSWPEACSYTVVCVPAFSTFAAGNESADERNALVDQTAREQLGQMHLAAGMAGPRYLPNTVLSELPRGTTPLVVAPVPVVEAPGITILEHFGNVASSDAVASLGRAVVKGPSQEAWQAPQFDEYVVCEKGSIEFLYGDGCKTKIVAGQGVFLPKNLRVKWVWPEATEYAVLCLPAFTPALCGREAEENATNAKDSASMARLEQLHASQRG